MLTGISPQGISPTGNYEQQAMALGANASNMMQGGLMGLTGQRDKALDLKKAVSNIKLDTPEGLRTMAQIKQLQGNTEAALALIKQAKALENSGSQAKAVADNLPAEYSALKDAIMANVSGALQKGIDILGAAKTPVDGNIVNIVRGSDKVVVATAKEVNGELFNSTTGKPLVLANGYGVSTTIPAGRGDSFNFGPNAKEEREQKNIDDQGDLYAVTKELVGPAVDNINVANTVSQLVANGTPMGTAAESVASLATTVQSVYGVLGKEPPEAFSKAAGDLSKMKKVAGDALIPFIDQQGRGFTDTERVFFLDQVIAGYNQPWQFNDVYATVLKSNALSDIEKNNFAYKIKQLDTKLTTAPENLWADYERQVPRLELGTKKYGDLDFQGAIVIEDNEDLSKYWSAGKGSPTGFRIKNGDKKDIVYTWKDLNSLAADAKGKDSSMDSVREILSSFSRDGILLDGVYK